MSAITYDLRMMWAAVEFLAMGYLGFLAMYVSPTARLRRWGERSWWRRFRLGPAWPTQIGQQEDRESELSDYGADVNQWLVPQLAYVSVVDRATERAALQSTFEAQHVHLPQLH